MDRLGVSEIIGTFLLLSITVVVFSGLILWLSSFEPEKSGRKADLSSTLDLNETGGMINITHNGGAVLIDSETIITIDIEGEKIKLTIKDGLGKLNWNIGEVWSYYNETIDSTKTVNVSVINRDTLIYETTYQKKPKQELIIFSSHVEPGMVPSDGKTQYRIFVFTGYNSFIPDNAKVEINLSLVGGEENYSLYYNPNGWYESTSLLIPIGIDAGTYFLNLTVKHGENEVYGKVRIVVEPPDFMLTNNDISFSNSTPYSGNIITIYANIWNIGGANGTGNISFYYDDKFIDNVTVDVGVDENKTVSVQWRTIVGEHKIYVKISNVTPDEIYVDNNIGSRKIQVKKGNEVIAGFGSGEIAFYNTLTWQKNLVGNLNTAVNSISFGDIDNDGKGDIAFGTFGGVRIIEIGWLRNSISSWEIFTIDDAIDIRIDTIDLGDFDKDGDLDLIAGSSQKSFLYIYTSSNNGATWTKKRIAVNQDVLSVKFSDFNKDGYLDIAVGMERKLLWVFMNGITSWNKVVADSAAAGNINELDVGDIDNDNDIDIIACSLANIYIYKNNGDGSSWTRTTIVTLAANVLDLGLGDLDNDGDIDIFASDEDANLHYFTNPTWADTIIDTLANAINDIFIGDVEFDSDIDIVCATAGEIYIYIKELSFVKQTIDSLDTRSTNMGDIE
ncbi:MAG: FG-GAP-like repeat-containing protein [Candidatus Thermoplasmatota archaeon]